jgi:hypothetical protein
LKKILTCFACTFLLITNIYAQDLLQGHIRWTSVDKNGQKMLYIVNKHNTVEELPSIEDALTYLTSDSIKEQILKSRVNLVFGNTRWVADGIAAYIANADGSIEKLPNFSDVFPGWDLASISKARTVYRGPYEPVYAETADFARDTPLTKGSPVAAHEFYYFNSGGNSAQISATTATTLASNASTYNVGFFNADTATDITWAANLKFGQDFIFTNPSKGTRYAVRASTYEEMGMVYITVKE